MYLLHMEVTFFIPEFAPTIGIRDRATGLCLRIARHLERLLGKVQGCSRNTIARDVYQVGTNAAEFEDTLTSPALELREAEDVRPNEILASFAFIEVFPCADGLR